MILSIHVVTQRLKWTTIIQSTSLDISIDLKYNYIYSARMSLKKFVSSFNFEYLTIEDENSGLKCYLRIREKRII